MVGKIKHVRQKLHQEAVKFEPSGRQQASLPALLSEKPPAVDIHNISPADEVKKDTSKTTQQTKSQSSFPTGIFASTKITADALKQTLKFEEPPSDLPPPAKKEPEDKKLKSKKEKMKERRERWLNKISFIKQAKEQQAATARRQATPVVGDLRPLADALPELCQLITPSTNNTTNAVNQRKGRKNKRPVKKKAEPTDFSQMKHSQKRKLMETETSRFRDAVKALSAKTNPLLDIGEHLRKRMRQEEEQGQT